MSVRLVVYGLLRRGQSMAHLLQPCVWLGRVTVPGHDLFDVGGYPGAVPGTGAVVGELVELRDPGRLAVLDVAEGLHEDPPLYRRVEVEVEGEPAWLYVYARSVDGRRRIASGDWAS